MAQGAHTEESGSRAKGGRIPASEMAKRLRDTEQMMLILGTDRKTAAAISEKFKIGHDQAMSYCRRVRDLWRADAGEFWERYGRDPVEVREEHRQRFAMIFGRAMAEKNLRAAIVAAERMGQLDGLLGARPVVGGHSLTDEASPIVEMFREMLAGSIPKPAAEVPDGGVADG